MVRWSKAIERLEDFVAHHAFLHDDSLPDNPLDEYCWHPALLAPPAMVVTGDKAVGIKYAAYLQEIGAWPDELLAPAGSTRSSLDNLGSDRLTQDRLVAMMVRQGLAISSFYPDNPNLTFILEAAAAVGVVNRLVPQIEPYTRLSERNGALRLLRGAGLPLLEGAICESEADVVLARRTLSSDVVIKQGHGPPLYLSEATPVPTELHYPLYVERFVEVVHSPNVQLVSWHGIDPVFSCDQIVSDLIHRGNCSRQFTEDVQRQLDAVLRSAEALAAGLDGPLGLDAVIDKAGRVWVVDINPRFNSCTYPQYFVAKHARDYALDFVYENVSFGAQTLDEVCMSNQFPRFDAAAGLGALVIGHVTNAAGRIQQGFLLSIGHNSAEASRIHAEAKGAMTS